jgi:hypothetical protein
MLLPALAAAPVDGLAVYPQPPEIRDHSERGEATGERIERASYVCQRPGKFEIPEQLLRWWNPENSSWQEKRFPAVSLEVTANPALAETPNAAAGTVAGTAEADYWLPRLLLAIVVLLTLAYLWPHLLAYLQRRQQARAASEPAQFARLIKTCHGTDPALAYRELTGWLGRFGYTTSDLSRAGGQPLAGELIRLQQALLDIARQNWDGRRLAETLRRLRRSCLLALHSTPRYSELPPLNPGLSSTSPKPDP